MKDLDGLYDLTIDDDGTVIGLTEYDFGGTRAALPDGVTDMEVCGNYTYIDGVWAHTGKLDKQAEEQAQEQEQAEAEAKAQAEEMAALPDAVAELSEMAADNETSAADLADAIADLSQLVSDLLESTSA